MQRREAEYSKQLSNPEAYRTGGISREAVVADAGHQLKLAQESIKGIESANSKARAIIALANSPYPVAAAGGGPVSGQGGGAVPGSAAKGLAPGAGGHTSADAGGAGKGLTTGGGGHTSADGKGHTSADAWGHKTPDAVGGPGLATGAGVAAGVLAARGPGDVPGKGLGPAPGTDYLKASPTDKAAADTPGGIQFSVDKPATTVQAAQIKQINAEANAKIQSLTNNMKGAQQRIAEGPSDETELQGLKNAIKGYQTDIENIKKGRTEKIETVKLIKPIPVTETPTPETSSDVATPGYDVADWARSAENWTTEKIYQEISYNADKISSNERYINRTKAQIDEEARYGDSEYQPGSPQLYEWHEKVVTRIKQENVAIKAVQAKLNEILSKKQNAPKTKTVAKTPQKTPDPNKQWLADEKKNPLPPPSQATRVMKLVDNLTSSNAIMLANQFTYGGQKGKTPEPTLGSYAFQEMVHNLSLPRFPSFTSLTDEEKLATYDRLLTGGTVALGLQAGAIAIKAIDESRTDAISKEIDAEYQARKDNLEHNYNSSSLEFARKNGAPEGYAAQWLDNYFKARKEEEARTLNKINKAYRKYDADLKIDSALSAKLAKEEYEKAVGELFNQSKDAKTYSLPVMPAGN